MRFNDHSNLEGKHAFLSPSKYSWSNYDDQKMVDVWRKHTAAAEGTRLHEFAKQAIQLGEKLPRAPRTLNMYVNDAISYGMTPEVTLFYSYNCFGHADTLSIRKKREGHQLRIHDYKSGESPTSMKQLEVYAALFFLEYKQYRPGETNMELRIYQSNDVLVHVPTVDEIVRLMDKIIHFDKILEKIRSEEG